MPDDSNTASRQESFNINKGKIQRQVHEAEKLEHNVKREEKSELPPQK